MNTTYVTPAIHYTMIGSGNDPDTGDILPGPRRTRSDSRMRNPARQQVQMFASAEDGFDRFGRVKQALWKSSSATKAQIEYGYDRASNRLWRKDGVLSGHDELYSYDGLYRLQRCMNSQSAARDTRKNVRGLNRWQ